MYFTKIVGTILVPTLTSLVDWFIAILSAGDFLGPFLTCFFIFLCGKFLLSPLLGSSGSDKAKPRKE